LRKDEEGDQNLFTTAIAYLYFRATREKEQRSTVITRTNSIGHQEPNYGVGTIYKHTPRIITALDCNWCQRFINCGYQMLSLACLNNSGDGDVWNKIDSFIGLI